MLGAIIGDLAGSVYEFEQINKTTKIDCTEVLKSDCFYSDDTILTIAILKAVLTDKNYEKCLKEFGLNYINYTPNTKAKHFKRTFSPGFCKWLQSNEIGKSIGNGAMMRISAVGYLFNDENEVIKNTRLATIPSHNTQEAIQYSTIIARIIFNARKGLSKKDLINKLGLTIQKPNINEFNYTCEKTIDICLWSVFNSNSFEESIKTAISFGGDTDTNACIVGSMAEAMYGIDKNLSQKGLQFLPDEFKYWLKKGYEKIEQNQTISLEMQ